MKEIEIGSFAALVSAVKDNIWPFDEKQLKNILEVFPYKNWEATSVELVANLVKNGHTNSGRILIRAHYENILEVSSIENDGMVYFELGLNGGVLWDEMDNKRKQEMWDTAYML